MKIVELTVQDMLNIEVAHIVPEGSVVTIGGENGAGKSSLLDAVMIALSKRDAKLHPMLVRRGAKKGKAVVDLGDLLVTYVCRESGTYDVTVANKEGAVYRNGREILDALVGPLSFDPLAWKNLPGPQMRKTLMQVLGIDFDSLDAKRKEAYDERTKVNAEIATLQGKVAAIPVDDGWTDIPAKPVDSAALLAKLQFAQNQRTALDQHTRRITALMQEQEHHQDIIASAQAAIAAAQKDLDAERVLLTNMPSAETVEATIQSLEGAIGTATTTNERVEKKRRRQDYSAELVPLDLRARQLTSAIERVDDDKETALKEAQWPVEGLGFTADGVMFDGIPWAQVSQGQKTRISTAMGLAMNPKLKILLIRNGSDLDTKSMATIHQMAEEHEAQVWLERVTEDPSSVQVFITEGVATQRVEGTAETAPDLFTQEQS